MTAVAELIPLMQSLAAYPMIGCAADLALRGGVKSADGAAVLG